MFLIDIEGTDGSGKATQTQLLFNHLSGLGYNCKILSFPNYESPSSAPVKMYLNGELGRNEEVSAYQASALYAVDRLITVKQKLKENYDFVLFDRYTYSNMIHQSTKIENALERDKFLTWVEDFEFNLLELPKPNLTLFLDVPAEISYNLALQRGALKNGQSKDILEGDYSHLKKAYSRAKYVAQKYGWLVINCVENGKILPVENIHNTIVGEVDKILKGYKKQL